MLTPAGGHALEALSVRQTRIHHAWWVAIVACLVLFFQVGVGTYVLGVLQTAWVNEFGWPRTWISLVYTGGSLLPGFTGVIVGRWCDQYGSRWVIIGGAVLITISYILLAFTDNFLYFAIVFSLSFIGRCGASNVSVSAAVAHWFVARRSFALGLASTGASLAGVVLVPLATWLVFSYNWRIAVVVLGLMAAAIVIPPSWYVLRGKPADWGLEPYGTGMVEKSRRAAPETTLSGALRGPSFWLLAVATVLGSAGLNSLGIHMLPAVLDKGVSPATGAAVISLMTGTAIVAKLILGWLCDHVSSSLLWGSAFLFQTVGYLMLVLAGAGPEIWPFAVVYGIGFGGMVALQPIVVADLFGVRAYGAILGAIGLPNAIVAAASPVFSASIRDTTGSYGPAFTTFAVSAALGALALAGSVLWLKRSDQRSAISDQRPAG